MKKIFSILTFVLVLNISLLAQQQYEIIREQNGTKILKGIISKDDIAKDTSFAWYAKNQEGYIPNADAVEALKKNNSIEIVAFVGTWCGDTKNIFPKFFSLIDASGFPLNKVTIIGVDRSKKTLSHLAEAFNVLNVPTFIVMKNGKEIGRVVEYGKYGMFDKELGEVINSINTNKPTQAGQ